MRYSVLAIAGAIAAISSAAAYAQQGADSAYIAAVSKAAPRSVVAGATIVKMQGGQMQTLAHGSNGFTCMVAAGTPMCADKNAMEWLGALQAHHTPPDVTGFIYMLAGDNGTSNTDPYATSQTAGNHWIKTGPHVMIVGPSAANMGYPASADPDVTKPYLMWPGTPYAHLMLPVTDTKP